MAQDNSQPQAPVSPQSGGSQAPAPSTKTPAGPPRFVFGILVVLALLALVAVVVYGQMQLTKKTANQKTNDYQKVIKSTPIEPPRPATDSSY